MPLEVSKLVLLLTWKCSQISFSLTLIPLHLHTTKNIQLNGMLTYNRQLFINIIEQMPSGTLVG